MRNPNRLEARGAARRRVRLVVSTTAAAVLALLAAGARAEGRAQADTGLKIQGAAIRAARSAPEAAAALDALAIAGSKSFAILRELVNDTAVHPEVRYYVTTTALRNPDPGAVLLAAELVTGIDHDLRMHAARVLESRAGSAQVELLIRQIPRESDDRIRASLLYALGNTRSSKASDVLGGYLDPAAPPVLQLAAAQALGHMRAAAQAPRVLALVRENQEDWLVDSLLESVRAMIGGRSEAQVVELAQDGDAKLRLWAVHELRTLLRQHGDPSADERAANVRRAAHSAFTDPSPMTRQRAVLAYGVAAATVLGHIADQESLEAMLAMLDDPAPVVRLAVVNSLYGTVVRRVIGIPDRSPETMAPGTMRMLRWPSDWQVFPRLVDLLGDASPKVRERAAWMLGVATGYWHGYDTIRLDGAPQLTADVRTLYREMWLGMRGQSPAAHAVEHIDRTLEALGRNDREDLHGEWMRGLRLLTGRDFGWSQATSLEERTRALTTFTQWWQSHRQGDPRSWVLDGLQALGPREVDPLSLYVLGRFVPQAMPPRFLDAAGWRDDPKGLALEVGAWSQAQGAEPAATR